MAFSFFGNYSKPGPGVSKDEPPKPAFFRFWSIIGRKWTKFIQLNWLFLLGVVVAVLLFAAINRITPLVAVCALPVILLFPWWGGLAYVTRNYAREEHAFVWADYRDAVKENFGKLLINGVVVYALSFVMVYAIQFYFALLMNNDGNWMYYIPLAFSVAIALIFLFAQYYIPLMVVTFDLKLRHVYKNAFIFAIVGLGRNLLLTLFLVVWIALHALAFYLTGWPLLLALLLFLLFDFSGISFLINFATYPLVEKMMIKPYYEKQAAEKEAKEAAKHPVLESEAAQEEPEEDEEDKPEYVFVNGKLVRRTRVDDDEDGQVFEDRT